MIRNAFLLTFLAVTGLMAQPFTISATLPDSTSALADGGTVTSTAAAIGQTVPISLTFTSGATGANTATFNSVQLTGSNDFTLTSAPEVSFTVGARGAFSVQLAHKPATSARSSARLVLSYVSSLTPAATNTLTINLVGLAPEFGFTYTPQGGNGTNLLSGGSILLPETALNATSTAVVVAANRGTASGTIQNVSISGAGFALVGAPVSGTIVDAGREVRFTVNYTAQTLDAASGALNVVTSAGSFSFALQAAGSGPRFLYQAQSGSSIVPVNPGQAIPIPDTLVGEKSSVVIRARNAGNAEGRIAAITVGGTGFTLSEVPLLPLAVPAGGTFAFTVNFSPTAPGGSAGRLRIGSDDFDLTSTGLGATLSYSFAVGAVSSPVANNGTVIFTPVAVGAASALKFTITNTGTTGTAVNSIALTAASTIFTVSNLPRLPLRLDAGASATFDLGFLPAAQGVSSATLKIDNATFTLSGTGTAPPDLPAYRYTGASGAQQPLQQPAVGLTLASAYPLALKGTLTLAFNSAVGANDPAVQFSTSGRTINFTIDAGRTQAVFANNANEVRIQTGSVAGAITVTPTFQTDGGIALTPANPPALNLTVAPAAPRILAVAVGARTASSISLVVSGYATSRSVTEIRVALTPTSGESVTTTALTIPASSSFLGWYQSAQSAAFGSLFSATIPLNFAGDVTNVTSPSDALASVSVTLVNEAGTSQAVSLALR